MQDPLADASRSGSATEDVADLPWQLRLYRKSLKKRQKVGLLIDQIRELPGERRLLITHGDNNGALNYMLRGSGGTWRWMEMEPDQVEAISLLLDDPVLVAQPRRLLAEDGSFDVVISLDVQEHLDQTDLEQFHAELYRVTAPGGHVVTTTPNGDPWKPVSVLRRAIGMTKEKYGHQVYGYTIAQHERMLRSAGFVPVAAGSYSGFFTEVIELGINFAYTTLLSRGKTGRDAGEIAPTTAERLAKVDKQYRMYAAAYPILRAISSMDALVPLGDGYAVSVVARRPG